MNWRLLLLVPWLIVIFIAASACSPSTVVKERVRTVSVAVPTQPIRPDQLPAVVSPLPDRPADPAAASDLLLAKVCQLYAYMLQADPLLRLSAGAPAAPVADWPACLAN